jgi:membrane-associated phospholipid phosphatase
MNRTPVQMLAAAAACVAAFVALAALVANNAAVQRVDVQALDGFVALGGNWHIATGSETLAHGFNPAPYAVMVAVLFGIGLIARRYRQVVAASVLLVGANISSQVLKPLLAHPRQVDGKYELSTAAFPSGHTTAAMSLTLAALLIAPRAYRPVVAALGGVLTLAVSSSLLVLGWHWPSDVFGGYLLATAWGLVAFGGARAYAGRKPDTKPASKGLPAGALAGAAVVALAFMLVLALARLGSITSYAQRHTAAFAVAATMVAAAMTLLAAVTALSARRG